MSYMPFGNTSGIGDRATAIVEAGKFLLQDPALPSVAGLVVDIYKLTPPSSTATGAVLEGRSALRSFVPALRAYRYSLKNPWSKWVAIAAIVGIPFAVGYVMGKK